jgi:hypothetical protein
MLIQTAKKLKLILIFKLHGCLGVLDTSVYSDVRCSTLHTARIFQVVQAYRPRSSQSETLLAKVCRMNAEGEDPCHRVQSLLCKSKMLKVDYISSKHGRRLLYPCELPSLPVLSHLRQCPMT